ncbi:hypothetical protein [Cereibacter johrii]|uniref:hypothetical protein n=1 Tax=Cereibacter johrii TaxID=445629 RepID=UPI0011BFDF7B|nr:hypothetical protein [Cereibacter johrii]
MAKFCLSKYLIMAGAGILVSPSISHPQEIKYTLDRAELQCLIEKGDNYRALASGDIIILALVGGGQCPEVFSLDDTLVAEGPPPESIGANTKDNIIYLSLSQFECIVSYHAELASASYVVKLHGSGCSIEAE